MWNAFVAVVKSFAGRSKKSADYKELVEHMMTCYHILGANMSIKVHFLHNYLDMFPENCDNVCDEQGERFHQNIRVMEERYQGRWDIRMMANYIHANPQNRNLFHSFQIPCWNDLSSLLKWYFLRNAILLYCIF